VCVCVCVWLFAGWYKLTCVKVAALFPGSSSGTNLDVNMEEGFVYMPRSLDFCFGGWRWEC